MAAPLTPKQTEIYDFILQYTRQYGYPPSVREIGFAVNLKSPSTVHFHMKKLEAEGYIQKADGKTRAISLPREAVAEELDSHENRVPVLGDVAAGSPILAQEQVEEYLTFDTGGLTGEHFALKVRGESMLYAGILPGDLVVVHRQETFREISWWPFLKTRPPSRPSTGKTGISGFCRRTRTTSPSTGRAVLFWVRSLPSSGAIETKNRVKRYGPTKAIPFLLIFSPF